MNRLLLRHKIPGAVVGSAVLAALLLGSFAYSAATDRLRTAAQDKLVALADARAASVQSYLEGLEGDIVLTANTRSMRDAAVALGNGWRIEGDRGDPGTLLRKRYVDDNPNPPAERYKMEKPEGSTMYDMAHLRLHSWMTDLMLRRGLADVLLLSQDGTVVYSAAKGGDFGKPAAEGPLAALANSVKRDPKPDEARAADFSAYAPAGGARRPSLPPRWRCASRTAACRCWRPWFSASSRTGSTASCARPAAWGQRRHLPGRRGRQAPQHAAIRDGAGGAEAL